MRPRPLHSLISTSTRNNLDATIDHILQGQGDYLQGSALFGSTALVLGSDIADASKLQARAARAVLGDKVQVCNGITADDVFIQAAVDSLTSGRTNVETVKLVGTFNPTASITLASYTRLDLTEAIINWDYADILFEYTGGSYGSSTALTANVAQADLSVSVTDESIFSVGSYVLIRSENINNSYNYKDGELHKVIATSAGSITLDHGAWNTYAVADTATAQVVNMATDIHIDGGYILGLSATQVKNVDVLLLDKVAEFSIKNMHIKNIARRALVFTNCINGEISENDIFGIDTAGYGYGYATSGHCSNLNFHHNRVSACRHCVTGGGISGVYGMPMGCSVNNNILSGSNITQSAVIDLHECQSWGMAYNNNIISGYSGMNVGATQWTAKGNTITSTNIGIGDRGDTSIYIDLEDNTFVVQGYCVLLDSTVLTDVYIDGVYGQTVDSHAIYINPNATSKAILKNCYINHLGAGSDVYGIWVDSAKYVEIIGCVVNNVPRSGIYLEGVSGGIVSNNISYNNNQAGSGTILRASGIIINNSTGLQIHNNKCFDDQGGSATQKYGIAEQGTSDSNFIHHNYVHDNTVLQITTVGTSTIVENNYGFSSSGGMEYVSGTLAAGNANDFTFAWQNPEAETIIVDEVMIRVATAGGTANSVLDVGSAAGSTTHSNNMIAGADLNTNNIYISTTRAILNANGGATDWITGQILVANAASLVGTYYIKYRGI